MPSIFDHIKIDNTYELFFPKKEQGLAIIWLYEKVVNGDFDKGIFKEKDIRQALDQAYLVNNKHRERNEWEYYNSHIMALQEFFLLYDEEHQTYRFKDYATYLCDKVFKMLSNRFNSTVIEITCVNLYNNLIDVNSKEEMLLWLEVHFNKSQLHLKEQIDFLNHQIDKSVKELSERAKLRNSTLLSTLREIDRKLDEIRGQNKELRGAFREIDRIKTILMSHSTRENEEIDDKVTNAIDYFESIRIQLNMVDTRINKIHPKIQQFFASLSRQAFDIKVDKFLNYLFDKSQIVSGEIILPLINDSFVVRYPSTNFSNVEKRDGLFVGRRNNPILYPKDPIKEAEAHKIGVKSLARQNHIMIWLEKIKRDTLEVNEYHLSKIFFEILEKHDKDLHLAVSVIYQSILFYNKNQKWRFRINNDKMIQHEKYNYLIWDIWMIRI